MGYEKIKIVDDKNIDTTAAYWRATPEPNVSSLAGNF
jgi:hypothetical protein